LERYLCIHGHFYQPPRENPWLEVIEQQDGARPYHDRNERITVECYAANTASRILDQHGLIERIVNNYAGISFDFGPTLLSWLESHAPEVYEALREADRESQRRFSGHGSALAQAYNHLILPLATARDKHTQVLWAIADFTYRFGRAPEGMWLPETAVDLETLAILAEHGIRFTILAPRQAQRVRDIQGKEWRDVTGERIDPTTAYAVRLPSGKSIAAFFYHGSIAQAVAFENLLRSGDSLAHRLHQIFSAEPPWPQLAHIATDGESYGHHHRFGEMALAYALQVIEGRNLARLTNYGEFLERYPPRHEVEVVENSSWSCAHGVERWRGDSGCSSGAHPEWRQTWRAPLRQALDWLRDTVAPLFEERAGRFLRDPWEARLEDVSIDERMLAYAFERRLEVLAQRFGADPAKLGALERLEAFTALVRRLPFDVNLWKAQNICYRVLHGVFDEFRGRAAKGDSKSERWLERFRALADHLLVRVAD